MKLIIDIDDKRIKGIKLLAKEQDIATPYPTLEQIIANGIPLDKLRAEIEGNMESIIGKYDSSIPKFNMPSYKIERNKAREECISIIDKYRGTDEITEHYKKLGEYYNGKDV